MTALFDPGLQPERTELAWRRTALSIGVGSLVALRLLPDALGDPWWIMAGVGGLVVATVTWVHGRTRARAGERILAREGDRGRMPGAGALAALGLFATAVGGLAIAIAVLSPGA